MTLYKKRPLYVLQNNLNANKSFDASNESYNLKTYNKNSTNIKDLNSSYDSYLLNYNNSFKLNSYNKNQTNEFIQNNY